MALIDIIMFLISWQLWIGLIVGYICGKYFNKQIETYINIKTKKAKVK